MTAAARILMDAAGLFFGGYLVIVVMVTTMARFGARSQRATDREQP